MAQRLLSIPPLYKQGWYKCGVPDAQWTGTSHTDTHTHLHTHTHTHTRQFAVHCLLLKGNSLVFALMHWCLQLQLQAVQITSHQWHMTAAASLFVLQCEPTHVQTPKYQVTWTWPALALVYCSSSLLFAGFHEMVVGPSCFYFLQMALVSCVLCTPKSKYSCFIFSQMSFCLQNSWNEVLRTKQQVRYIGSMGSG